MPASGSVPERCDCLMQVCTAWLAYQRYQRPKEMQHNGLQLCQLSSRLRRLGMGPERRENSGEARQGKARQSEKKREERRVRERKREKASVVTRKSSERDKASSGQTDVCREVEMMAGWARLAFLGREWVGT